MQSGLRIGWHQDRDAPHVGWCRGGDDCGTGSEATIRVRRRRVTCHDFPRPASLRSEREQHHRLLRPAEGWCTRAEDRAEPLRRVRCPRRSSGARRPQPGKSSAGSCRRIGSMRKGVRIPSRRHKMPLAHACSAASRLPSLIARQAPNGMIISRVHATASIRDSCDRRGQRLHDRISASCIC